MSVDLTMTYDATTGCLRVDATAAGARDLVALTLQSGGPDSNGPVLAVLLRAAEMSANHEVRLGFADRRALQRGGLYVHLYTCQFPLGVARLPIVLDVDFLV